MSSGFLTTNRYFIDEKFAQDSTGQVEVISKMIDNKDLNRSKSDEQKKEERRMRDKTIAIVGIVISVIASWDNIVKFLQSFFSGINQVLVSLPPIFWLGLLIFLFWKLGNQKE